MSKPFYELIPTMELKDARECLESLTLHRQKPEPLVCILTETLLKLRIMQLERR